MLAVERVTGEGVGGEDAANAGDGGGAQPTCDRDRAFVSGCVAGGGGSSAAAKSARAELSAMRARG